MKLLYSLVAGLGDPLPASSNTAQARRYQKAVDAAPAQMALRANIEEFNKTVVRRNKKFTAKKLNKHERRNLGPV